MNCTSAGEGGGKVARVEDGNVRVGSPGAPGWTTTGASFPPDVRGADPACCANTGSDRRHARVHTWIGPGHVAARITKLKFILIADRQNFMVLVDESLEDV